LAAQAQVRRMIELSAKQVIEYAVPLIYQTMGEQLGERAEAEWEGATGDETGVYARFDAHGLVAIGGIGAEISKRKVWLGYLAVRSDRRGRGIGGLLLSYVEDIARSRGYREIFVETYAHPIFTAACKLYEKAGYQRVGELAEYLDDGSDVIFYRKQLQ